MANITPNTKEEQDSAYDPLEMSKRENGAHDDIPGYKPGSDGLDDHPISAGSANGVRESEESPTAKWRNLYAITKEVAQEGKKSFLKGKGPLLFIGGGIGLGGIGGLLLLVPSLLFFHLLANMFDTFDPSAPALTQITKIMLVNKLGASGATSGSCQTVKIACRFKTPSNELLRQLKANGITPLDEGGKPMDLDTKEKWPAAKPASYEVSSFHAEDGKAFNVKATELSGKLESNTTFRMAFNKTIKNIGNRAFSRYSPAMLRTLSKFNVGLRDALGLRTNVAEGGKRTLTETIAESVKLKGAAGQAIEDVASAASSIAGKISLRVNTLLTLVGKMSKGSGVVLAASLGCVVNEIPGMIKKTMVSLQEAGIVSAGAPVVTAMSAIKAGDGTPEASAELGKAWTEQDSTGKAATDAIGIRNANFGDTDTSTDPTYQKVMPTAFGDLLTNLNVADAILKNPVSNTACTLLMNPVTGAAIATGINVAITAGSGPAAPITFAFNLALGVGMTALISNFDDQISGAVGNAIAPLAGLAQPTLDQLATPGPTFGNVTASSVGLISESNGAATFGTALTTDKLAAYSQTMREQELADAELDRATLSPLDASSRYTFLGSIVNQFLPYYSSLSSAQGTMSVIGSMLPISFGSILKSSTASAADDPANAYTNACPYPDDLKAANGKTLAANIFCQSVYAMNVSDSWNPDETVAFMGDQINDQTGEAKKSDNSVLATIVGDTADDLADLVGSDTPSFDLKYDDWLNTCTDTENAAQCTSDDLTQKQYGLYTAAKTVNSMIDMEEPPRSSGTGIKNTSDPRITTVVNKKNPNSPLDYTPTDLVDITKCSTAASWQVRSEAAAAFETMVQAAKTAGIPGTICSQSAYRSYSTQVDVYNDWVSQLGQTGADLTSARPGYSEHQIGLAIDIWNSSESAGCRIEQCFSSSPSGQWLAENAYQFGYVLRYPDGMTSITGYEFEPWHYRYIGVAPAKDMHDKGILTLEEYYGIQGGEGYAYNHIIKSASQVAFDNRKVISRTAVSKIVIGGTI